MKCYEVKRSCGDCKVLLLPHKDGSGYSYVNLTSGHICKCKFKRINEALEDMMNRSEVESFKEIPFNMGGE